MVFSSLLFLFRFLPVMLAVYYGAPKRLRNGVLFLGSLIFYGWGEPVFILLLLFSTGADYVHGLLVWHFRRQGRKGAARNVLISSVCINLGLLGFFKYWDFFARTANACLGGGLPVLELSLPVGISFYTFQTMSYTIDIYRGEETPQKSFLAFGAYVSMFPQLIAGPIVRYGFLAGQLRERRESLTDFSYGVRRFVCGLGKKVLIANQCGALWEELSRLPVGEQTIVLAWIGLLAFGLQIYFDFSGYSDMAIGLGAMLGFRFPENFCYPYTAESITDFWRRWHITLGTWFREYVYIPLGGNRRRRVSWIRNILIVWLLTGIWHGAAMNYLLWGLYFGVLLFLEKLVLKKYLEKCPSALKRCYAMSLVFLGWVLFAHEDLSAALHYYKLLFFRSGAAFGGRRTWYTLFYSLPFLGAAILGATPLPAAWRRKLPEKWLPAADGLFTAGVFLLSVAFLVDAGYNPFLYFRF